MARIRSIKPAFCESEAIAALSVGCQLHFVKLWTYADDEGRGRDNARLIKGALWPLCDEVDVHQVEDWQCELARAGRIERYEVDGRRYFQVANWAEHQKPQHPRPSECPPPPPNPPPSASQNGNTHLPAPEQAHEDDRKPHEESPDSAPVVVVGEVVGEGEGDVAPEAFGPDVGRLCDRLADAIEANGSKRPRVGKTWLKDCDLMLRVDERTPEQVERAIDWSQDHHFWRSNILSMGKLREKFDQMRLQAQAEKSNGQRAPNTRPSNLALLRESLEDEEMAG